jgi:cell division protease FtsH
MTAVAATSSDLRRRGAIALATLVAALAVPASAQALTFCVTPAVGGCAQSFPTKDLAIEAADKHAGDDVVRLREGADTRNIKVPASTVTDRAPRSSVFDDVTNFMLTWLPLIFMGIICLLIGLTMRYMPRTKPQEIKPDTHQSTRWEDVAGAEEAKDELREVVEFLRDPKRFKKLGAKVPKGVLLHGPPGTGKTLLARAVAGESGAAFFAQSASSFVEMFVGLGSARIRKLFETARAQAPAIIFIDELDAVGMARSGASFNREADQTLNQLLIELDGFADAAGVVVMASTNRLDHLDPALLRPGRFDRQVLVPPPDIKGRREILDVHTRGKPLADDVDLDAIARTSSGLTGADLANLCNEAAIRAGRARRISITAHDFDDATERVVAGLLTHRAITEKEKRIIAYHEAGHALMSHLLGMTPVHKVSIIPRGMALGYAMTLPDEDRFLTTREELIDQMTMSLSGRVAEIVVFGRISSGAASDLEYTSKIARWMVCQLGMGTIVESRTLLAEDGSLSEETKRLRDAEQERLTNGAFEEALRLIGLHRETLDRLAERLLEVESLDRAELLKVLADVEPERAHSDEVGRVLGVAAARDARRHPAS